MIRRKTEPEALQALLSDPNQHGVLQEHTWSAYQYSCWNCHPSTKGTVSWYFLEKGSGSWSDCGKWQCVRVTRSRADNSWWRIKREDRRSCDKWRMVPLNHESLISINSVHRKQHNKLNLKPCNVVAAQTHWLGTVLILMDLLNMTFIGEKALLWGYHRWAFTSVVGSQEYLEY